MHSDTVTIDECRTLIKLCEAGKLYDIEKWIASGKSLKTLPGAKKSILSVVVTTQFHSLIELIARNETDQQTKNQALLQAISQRQCEIVQLLLHHGADLKAAPLIDVLRSWDSNMIRFFLENGADPIRIGL